ncbi:MAG: Phosphopantetheine adenylyltransferase, partial [uncultured Frankineae bacterium]
ATGSLSRFLRPRDPRSPRHRRTGLGHLRRGHRRRPRQQEEVLAVHGRGAHGPARPGHRGLRQRQGRQLPRTARRLLPHPADPRHRQGPARDQRLRLRAADGPDEPRPGRRRDDVHDDQPAVLLPVLQPGQGGRDLRRGRLRARAAAGARAPRRAPALLPGGVV